MKRCGCEPSAPTESAISPTRCITKTGAGTPADPFRLFPVVDPVSTNLLSCGGNGLNARHPHDKVWTPYTPSWTGGAPSIGGGTLLGYYCRWGQTVEFQIFWSAGPGTYLGSGAVWRFGLPFPPFLPSAFPAMVGLGGNGINYPGSALAGSGHDFIDVVMIATSSGPLPLSADSPLIATDQSSYSTNGWTLGSYIAIAGVYQTLG